MEKFIHDENIRLWRQQLADATDEQRRQVLCDKIAEEEATHPGCGRSKPQPGRISFVPKDANQPNTGGEPISAVSLSEFVTSKVDAWAEVHEIPRSAAICRLVEIGLKANKQVTYGTQCDALAIEELAVGQISELIHASMPSRERQRRIRRLIEGPAEFSSARIDRPK
jgi:hypothetical protein